MRVNSSQYKALRINPGIAFLIVISCAFQVKAQNIKGDTLPSFSVNASVGYSTYALKDVKDFYSSLLEIYSNSGIVVPTQYEYPGNILFSGSLLYNIPRIVQVGLASQYSRTKAFSGYEDYAGSINVRSKISFITLEGMVQHDITSAKKTNLFVGLRGGIVFVKSDYAQDIIFNDIPDQTGNVTLSGKGHGYTAEGYVGIKRSIKNLNVGICLGYRRTIVSKLDGRLSATGQPTYSSSIDLEHDLSGVVIKAQVDFRLGENK